MSSASASLAATTAATASPTETHNALGEDRLGDGHVGKLVQHRTDRLHARKLGGRDERRALGAGEPLDVAARDRTAHETHPMPPPEDRP